MVPILGRLLCIKVRVRVNNSSVSVSKSQYVCEISVIVGHCPVSSPSVMVGRMMIINGNNSLF